MESPDERTPFLSNKDDERQSETLVQLQRLAMLYHARGRATEAEEIYRLIQEIKKVRPPVSSEQSDSETTHNLNSRDDVSDS
jgi:hypothetical protein